MTIAVKQKGEMMSGWGIADTAPKIEKIKAESADYLHGLDSCGIISWSTYSDMFDFYAYLIEKAYEQGKEDAQPEQRWILCGERLPEDEYVLISKKPTKISGSKWSVAIAIRTADPRSGKIQWRDSGFGVIQDDKVLAWMPLPKPYQEGKQDG